MNLTDLLDECDEHVKVELDSMPEVEDVTGFDPTIDAPPISARRWLRVTDAVAVVADLKSSTKLGLHKFAQSTASIYEAALHPVVDIFHEFGAGCIPIQGDCVIGLFWDAMAVERAMCAGVTVKTFSVRHLVERMTKKWPQNLPETGFKVGIAASTVLVKRVGRPQTPHQALVWPGKALNYAVKAAQSGDAHEVIVAGSVWDKIAANDYLTFSCDCAPPSPGIWRDHDIEKLDHDDAERGGRCLTSPWCEECGETFCNAILDGLTHRESVEPYRAQLELTAFRGAIFKQRARQRANQRHLRLARTGR